MARLSGFFANGLLTKATSPLADTAITFCSTFAVWKVGMLMKFNIACEIVPGPPKRLIGTQPRVLTLQVVVFTARAACCSLVKPKPLPVVRLWSERPSW